MGSDIRMQVFEVAEKLFILEKQLNLFEQKVQGVYFWKLVRFRLYTKLLEYLQLSQTAHIQEYNSMLDKVKALFPKIKNTYFHSVFSRSNTVDILIIEHGRKVLTDENYVDIYTDHKVKELKSEKRRFEIVDRPYLGKHYNKPSKDRSYAESITVTYLLQKYFKTTILTPDESKLIENIEKELFATFGFSKNLKRLIGDSVKLFKLKKEQYERMLLKRGIKQVYLVVSYTHEALIAACKDLGIECIEIQHGTMSRYHLGYSFPYNSFIHYFPDKIELFGKYWQDYTPLPLNSEKISIKGYTYLFDTWKKFREVNKNKNQVVFLSQGTNGEKLAQFAYMFANKYNECKIIYKLHPGEFGRWRTSYPVLKQALKLNNFELIENKRNLYHILQESSFVVGVYSTAIYESLTLGCKVILIDLPGVKEHMQPLLDLHIAKKVSTIDEMKETMQQDEFGTVEKDYFFKEQVCDENDQDLIQV